MQTEVALPPLVRRAQSVAATSGFAGSCTDDVGHLLRALAATVSEGTIGEIGTGSGVGTAWMASALHEGVRLVTVESDPQRAAGARALFASVPGVQVLEGDWHAIVSHGPFALLFADGGRAKEEDLYALVRPGGAVVLDDFTDPRDWDATRTRDGDALRDRWLTDERFASVMLGAGASKLDRTKRAQVLIAARLG